LPKNLAVASEDDDEEAADADAGSSTAGG
jgi:hypothetical protein